MNKDEIIEGLKSGRTLCCDQKNNELLPWLLSNPDIENSGIIQVDDQYSYIKFWWRTK